MTGPVHLTPPEGISPETWTAITLSPADLDRMAEAQREADDCRAAATLFPYAPDPEADYAEGVRDGYLLGLNDAPPIQWMPRTVSRGDQLIKLALFCLFIGVVTWAAVL